jgi:hypothetical protein
MSNAHKVSNTLWTYPAGSPVPIRRLPEGLQQPVGAFSQRVFT